MIISYLTIQIAVGIAITGLQLSSEFDQHLVLRSYELTPLLSYGPIFFLICKILSWQINMLH